MAKFWKDGKADPKRKFRFLVSMGAAEALDIQWWAKTVTLPEFEISEIEHDFLDNKYYYPGRVTWNEVTVTLIDPGAPDMVSKTLKMLSDSGYAIKDKTDLNAPSMITKGKSIDTGLGSLVIEVIDAVGTKVETWTLNNPWIKTVKYGEMDYSSDDIRTIEMTVRYDWAECAFNKPADEPSAQPEDFDPT